MLNILRKIVNYKYSPDVCKRFAGHSKWQNIRHTKAEKDAERAAMYNQFIKRMKIAITDGASAKPEQNIRLAKVIEQAKKACMTNESINTFLKKAQDSKNKAQNVIFAIQGPGGCYLLVQLHTDNAIKSKMLLSTICRKTFTSLCDTIPKGIFQYKGIIITDTIKDLDSAMEDAITTNAEDVEELDENTKLLQFTCEPLKLMNVRSRLEKLNYNIVSAEEEYLPLTFTNLNEEQEKLIEKLYKRLQDVEEVINIYSNIE